MTTNSSGVCHMHRSSYNDEMSSAGVGVVLAAIGSDVMRVAAINQACGEMKTFPKLKSFMDRVQKVANLAQKASETTRAVDASTFIHVMNLYQSFNTNVQNYIEESRKACNPSDWPSLPFLLPNLALAQQCDGKTLPPRIAQWVATPEEDVVNKSTICVHGVGLEKFFELLAQGVDKVSSVLPAKVSNFTQSAAYASTQIGGTAGTMFQVGMRLKGGFEVFMVEGKWVAVAMRRKKTKAETLFGYAASAAVAIPTTIAYFAKSLFSVASSLISMAYSLASAPMQTVRYSYEVASRNLWLIMALAAAGAGMLTIDTAKLFGLDGVYRLNTLLSYNSAILSDSEALHGTALIVASTAPSSYSVFRDMVSRVDVLNSAELLGFSREPNKSAGFLKRLLKLLSKAAVNKPSMLPEINAAILDSLNTGKIVPWLNLGSVASNFLPTEPYGRAEMQFPIAILDHMTPSDSSTLSTLAPPNLHISASVCQVGTFIPRADQGIFPALFSAKPQMHPFAETWLTALDNLPAGDKAMCLSQTGVQVGTCSNPDQANTALELLNAEKLSPLGRILKNPYTKKAIAGAQMALSVHTAQVACAGGVVFGCAAAVISSAVSIFDLSGLSKRFEDMFPSFSGLQISNKAKGIATLVQIFELLKGVRAQNLLDLQALNDEGGGPLQSLFDRFDFNKISDSLANLANSNPDAFDDLGEAAAIGDQMRSGRRRGGCGGSGGGCDLEARATF